MAHKPASNPKKTHTDLGDYPVLVCLPKMLPRPQWVDAARTAVDINPVNHPPIERLGLVQPGLNITAEHIAVLTTKYWRSGAVKLTVGFLDTAPSDLRTRILLH